MSAQSEGKRGSHYQAAGAVAIVAARDGLVPWNVAVLIEGYVVPAESFVADAVGSHIASAASAGSSACSIAVGCSLLFAAVPPVSVEDTQAGVVAAVVAVSVVDIADFVAVVVADPSVKQNTLNQIKNHTVNLKAQMQLQNIKQ